VPGFSQAPLLRRAGLTTAYTCEAAAVDGARTRAGAGAGVLLLDEPFGAPETGDMVYVRTRRERTFSA
jgi:hypothetical protein